MCHHTTQSPRPIEQPGANRRLRTALLLLLLLLALPAAAGKPADFDHKREAFVTEMAQKHGFDPARLQRLMQGARYRQSIIDAITRPAEGKAWHQYRPIFVTDARAREGADFWRRNEALLQQAEAKYGVPPEIVTAIIGVETRYGRHSGKYPVLDALSTLAFGYPKRGDFFRRELEQFLLLSRKERVAAESALGSYAGALGMPQFIPSSYRAYAVDFDGDGKRDLWHSTADVIGSVAAYFKRHGWRAGEPITIRANGAGKADKSLLEQGMKPKLSIARLKQAGIRPQQPLPDDTLASLIRLEGKGGDEYWLGLNNFYVITRYNHSNLYAMAVYQLSRKIMQQYQRGGEKRPQ